MDLSYNQFQGRLPQSLPASCLELKVLKLENNHFRDVFPSWLGNRRELKLLLLRGNHFYGEITSKYTSDYHFHSLQIMDLSHNNLSGALPSHYFQKLNAMKDFDSRKSSYLNTSISLSLCTWKIQFLYTYSVTITYKGRDMEYGKILEFFTVIDLSSNRFHGDIPECVGNLRGLQLLNLSNNMLDGSIPSSLSNITQLESLDLSQNKLSGEIPQQLVRLTFLEFFNVSFNRLRGLTPQGSQFSTFDSSSYEGNAGLRGLPVISTPTRAPPSASGSEEEDNQDSRSWFESNWMTILPGFVGGLMFGVAIEHLLAIDKRIWFIKFFDFGVVTKTKWRKGRKLRRLSFGQMLPNNKCCVVLLPYVILSHFILLSIGANFNSPRSPSSANLDSDEDEDGRDSRSWFELYWITILPGFVGGLIFGVALEQVLAMDKSDWFVKASDFLVVIKAKGVKARKNLHRGT
ncbi:hypothetical protein TIFTF001_031273 [Ficus carica]|uniref:Receptor-like protein 12 n=1 Tax=Ficus carica TaxID=3494 RepID=A0AA88J4Y1_FICCA|nr:hypothetical protein TIFTF001_031273 [Ficus carica]